MSEMIDLSNTNLGEENLGDEWTNFILKCSPLHAKLFNEAYNLIDISFPESFFNQTLTHILIDESIDKSDTIAHVRKLFIDTIIEALQIMGIYIDYNQVEMRSLSTLKVILDSIYLLDGVIDILGLVDILNDEELVPKDRFIKAISVISPTDEVELEHSEMIIKEVGVNAIRGIMIGLNVIDEDDTTWIDPSLKRRIKANKAILSGTMASTHLTNGGGPGLIVDNYFNIFMGELAELLVTNQSEYLKNVLSLLIISACTDEQIYVQFNNLIEQNIEDMETIFKANELLKKVNINE